MGKSLSSKKQQIKSKIGKPPGTLIYVGESKIEKAVINVVEYNDQLFSIKQIDSRDDLKKYKERSKDKVTWISVNGLSDIELLSFIGETFNIHSLFLEDIINSNQQPKVDYHEDDIFVVLKKTTMEENQEISLNQVSLWFTSNLLITFHDDPKEDFTHIHQRIEAGKNVFRKSKEDYLFYVLIDYIVDGYFLIVEEISEKIEALQEMLIREPDQDTLQKIQLLRKEAYKTKQAVRPVRELTASIIRQESDYISEATLIYFRDTMDHVIQITEALEVQRESITTLIDIYLSSISNRMNEVMKVLTIIATIFIPLTFIAGIYGMNFVYMPELEWKFGYFAVWAVMLLVGIALILFFKKKKWL